MAAPVRRGRAEKSSKKGDILNRPLPAGKDKVSLSSFAFLFCELVQYCQGRVTSMDELESKLASFGRTIGSRALDMMWVREKPMKRPTKLIDVLLFVQTNIWRSLFGAAADTLEKSTAEENEYRITDNEPLVNRFISIPRDMESLNCAAFVAGMIEGVLSSTGFDVVVIAHNVPLDDLPIRTIYQIKVSAESVAHEA